MKNAIILIFILFSFSTWAQLNRTLFNDNWEFYLNPSDPATIVNLPHTPRLEPLEMKGQFLGEVVYKKYFNYKLDSGKQLFIEFEGAMHSAKVRLNGQEIGSHVGGYLPFSLDLTAALKDSFNLLEVVLNNQEDPT
ncbi:MAG: sugar-binding domain-containing protein, partial [Crocinitomicaceae bacterium]